MPEGILDDGRGVVPHAQLQKEELLPRPGAKKIGVPLRGRVPALVLHKCIVAAEVHGHGSAAVGAAGQQVAGHLHILLPLYHLPHELFVVKRLLTARLAALPQAVVALRVEQPLLIEPRPLELVIHVGGDDEVVLVPHQLQKVVHTPAWARPDSG